MAEKVSSTRKQRRHRRQLGVNFGSCLREYRKLKEEGGVDMADSEAVAEEVMSALVLAKADTAGIDWDNIDWEKLFEFVMRIIQLIMSFFA